MNNISSTFGVYGIRSDVMVRQIFGAEWADGSYQIELAKRRETAKSGFVMFEDGVAIADKSMEAQWGWT